MVLHREIAELSHEDGITQLKQFIKPYEQVEIEPVGAGLKRQRVGKCKPISRMFDVDESD